MNFKNNMVKVLLLVGFSAVAIPASAVSFNGSFHAQRFNNKGTTTAVLRPSASNFCYLSEVSVEETDTGGEEAKCRVRRSRSVWLLEAILDKSSNADVECNAICYRN